MSENAKWYVVHTYSGYEKKVSATILKTVENRKMHDLIFEVNVPVETVTETADKKRDYDAYSDTSTASSDGKSKTYERKLFPGYVLVRMIMTDESWHVVRNTRGVTGFVGPGSKPVALTDEEVAALGVEKTETIVPYAVGDTVRLIDCAMENFVGVVDEIEADKDRVRVIVSMFGRDTPVELRLYQAEPIVT